METPICSSGLGFGLLLLFRLAREMILPGDTTAQIVPVDSTIEGNEAEGAPENPAHLTDHPHVRLTHVVGNMEHHLNF